MKRKDLEEKSGLSRDQIKYLLKMKVFIPENPSVEHQAINYTENDIIQLKTITLLNKAGFSSKEARHLLDNKDMIAEELDLKREKVSETIHKLQSSLELLIPLCKNKDRFGKV